jgi:glycosyltransferase involved in cell wall biosynthesis
MKFSIIIPTYSASKTLEKALNSVSNQNYSDYEIMVVDGGSTDGTQKILKEYEEKFAGRLRWRSEKDKGVYDAMNKGIDLARGEWIYFLGSDDALHSNKVLEKVTEAIKRNNPDVVYGNVMWGETGKIYDGRFSVLKLMRKNICHQAIFFKRDVFQKFGKYNLKYKVLADHVFNMRWFNDDNVKKKYINFTIANYSLDGQSSASSSPDEEFTKDRDELMKKYFPKSCVAFDKERCQNEKLQRVVREFDLLKPTKFWKWLYYFLRIKSLFFKNHS